jgi:N-acyl-D-aspartate/D-glutamate deacylase
MTAYDVIFRNGAIYDGNGHVPFVGDGAMGSGNDAIKQERLAQQGSQKIYDVERRACGEYMRWTCATAN